MKMPDWNQTLIWFKRSIKMFVLKYLFVYFCNLFLYFVQSIWWILICDSVWT